MKYVEINLEGHEKAALIPISDSHKGDARFDEARFLKLIEDIAKIPYAYGFLSGDLINNAVKNGKSDVYSDKCTPQEQKRWIINRLRPIRHKLLGCTGGNHEERTWKESGQDISEDIATALDIPYDPFGIFYQINVGKKGKQMNYTMYSTHGSGGGGTKGAKINKLHSLRNICLADVYVMGHVHDVMATADVYYVPDTRHSRLVKQKRYYAVAGSYLDWGGYAERLGLTPSLTGFPIIELNGTKKKINITI